MDQDTGSENNDFELRISLDESLQDSVTGKEEESSPSPSPSRDSTPGAGSGEAEPGESRDSRVQEEPQEAGRQPQEETASAIRSIQAGIEELDSKFESKLKYDEHKNKVIDDLHQSLQEYRDGLLKKYLQRIFTDVIKIVDDARKLSAHYRQEPASEENFGKLLQYLEDIANDLEDLFGWEGVVAFNTEGETHDPAKQRVVKKIETDNPSMDKVIAQRLRPGYEWDGRIIRPEIVSIYICNQESATENKES